MKNEKGFTLIELLAVIVILGVLLAIAVPSVTKYINASKKSTFIENAQAYAKAAKNDAMLGAYDFPVSTNQATIITFGRLETALENGGITSSYGGNFDSNSYVIIVNEGKAEDPRYIYYIAARDSKGYGIGNVTDDGTVANAIAYDSLKSENIVQLDSGFAVVEEGKTMTINGNTITITKSYK